MATHPGPPQGQRRSTRADSALPGWHAPLDQRLLGARGLRGAVFEVLVAVETKAGKGTHVLPKVHLAVLVGIQNTHEFIVVTLPELTLWKG